LLLWLLLLLLPLLLLPLPLQALYTVDPQLANFPSLNLCSAAAAAAAAAAATGAVQR
jgi:hypothetical protein